MLFLLKPLKTTSPQFSSNTQITPSVQPHSLQLVNFSNLLTAVTFNLELGLMVTSLVQMSKINAPSVERFLDFFKLSRKYLSSLKVSNTHSRFMGLRVLVSPMTYLLGLSLILVLQTQIKFRHFNLLSVLSISGSLRAPNSILWAAALSEPEFILSPFELALNKANMFTHRRMVSSMQTTLLSLFRRGVLSLMGFVFFMMGKISVGGNSSTRSMHTKVGRRSASKMPINAVGGWGLVYTSTGCLGFHMLLFF